MSRKKYQIFVSSTFRDLIDERADIIKSILDLNHIPAGMELFPAIDLNQLSYIKKIIDECDYYIIIIGGRYGSTDGEGVSFTEKEYDYACSIGKPVLAFVHADTSSIPVGKSEQNADLLAALMAFRAKVMSGRLVKQFHTRQELELTVLKSLMHAFNELPQIGWVRGDAVASQEIIENNNKLHQEIIDLQEKVAKAERQVPIAIEDVAGFSDEFRIRYTFHFKPNNGYQSFLRADSLSATWKEIFLNVAAFLDTPKSDDCIDSGIRQLQMNRGSLYKVFEVNKTDKVTIKLQLLALGLIFTENRPAINGVVYEYLALTEKGKRELMDGVVVRTRS